MARPRKVISFNPNVPAHQRAWKLWEDRGFSSDFAIECILLYDQLFHSSGSNMISNVCPMMSAMAAVKAEESAGSSDN